MHKLKILNGNHIPEAAMGNEKIPAPMADPAVIIIPESGDSEFSLSINNELRQVLTIIG